MFGLFESNKRSLRPWQIDHVNGVPRDEPFRSFRGTVSLNGHDDYLRLLLDQINRSATNLPLWQVDDATLGLEYIEMPKIYLLSEPKDFGKYVPQITNICRVSPDVKTEDVVIWRGLVEVCLVRNDAAEPHDEKRFFDLLKSNYELLERYKDQVFYDGYATYNQLIYRGGNFTYQLRNYKTLRDFLIVKYRFMNRVLDTGW